MAEALLFFFYFKEEYVMDICIKLINDETFAIRDVAFYKLVDGYWQVTTTDGLSAFFNKDRVEYICDRHICFY